MRRAAHKTVLNSAFWSGYIAYDGWRLPPDVKAGTRQLALAMLPKPKLAANLFPEAEPIDAWQCVALKRRGGSPPTSPSCRSCWISGPPPMMIYRCRRNSIASRRATRRGASLPKCQVAGFAENVITNACSATRSLVRSICEFAYYLEHWRPSAATYRTLHTTH